MTQYINERFGDGALIEITSANDGDQYINCDFIAMPVRLNQGAVNIKFENCRFFGRNPGTPNHALNVKTASACIFRNLYFHGTQRGVVVQPIGSGVTGCTFEQIFVSNVRNVTNDSNSGEAFLVEGNSYGGGGGDGEFYENTIDGIFVSDVDGTAFSLYDCRAYDNTISNIRAFHAGPVFISAGSNADRTVYENTFSWIRLHHCRWSVSSAGVRSALLGLDSASHDNTIEDVIIIDPIPGAIGPNRTGTQLGWTDEDSPPYDDTIVVDDGSDNTITRLYMALLRPTP